MTILGTPERYHHKYNFKVEIDDFSYFGFMKCSELSAEVAKVEVKEGGALLAHKEAGMVEFADVTLERGATDNQEMYLWFKEVVSAWKNTGRVNPNYKRNLDIVQMERDGQVVRRWSLTEAWPTKFVAGEWDNDANEAVIESLTLTFKLFKQPGD